MKLKKTMKNSMLLQLFFYYLIGNLLFILFLSSIFYYTSKYLIMNKEIEYTNENVISTSRYITLYADKLKNIINLLSVDANPQSIFYQGLEAEIRTVLLHQGLYYLSKEKDTTGFSSQYGWVHAFAHGGDLLTEVICHPSFPKSDIAEAFEIIGKIFKRVEIRFTNDEDWRLARAFYEPILRGKIEPSLFTAWLQTVEFPLKEANDFHKFSNFRSCLLEIYLQLDCHNLLQDDLKKIIQSFHY